MTTSPTFTDTELAEIHADLASTQALKLKCLGEIRRQRAEGVATVSSIAKLDLIVDACSRWISRYERDLRDD